MIQRAEPPSHLDLVAAVRSVQRLASAGETDLLHDQVCRLRNALVAHIHDERQHAPGSSDIHDRLVRRGQDELLQFIDDLLSTTTDHGEHCACLVHAADLGAMLLRQMQLESRHRPRGRGPR